MSRATLEADGKRFDSEVPPGRSGRELGRGVVGHRTHVSAAQVRPARGARRRCGSRRRGSGQAASSRVGAASVGIVARPASSRAARLRLTTTNLEYEAWYDFLGRKEMVKALLDRLRHRCTTIAVEGSSLRTPEP